MYLQECVEMGFPSAYVIIMVHLSHTRIHKQTATKSELFKNYIVNMFFKIVYLSFTVTQL